MPPPVSLLCLSLSQHSCSITAGFQDTRFTRLWAPGDHLRRGCKAGRSAKPKRLAYHRGVLGPRRGQGKKRWYFWLRIQLGYIALVQTVLWVTCFLLWSGNWGEILLYGVLSKSQVLQSPHRVVPSQPAELYVIPIVAPCRVKECPDQCKTVADWTGLENAVRQRQQKLCLDGVSPETIPCKARHDFSSVVTVCTQNETTC